MYELRSFRFQGRLGLFGCALLFGAFLVTVAAAIFAGGILLLLVPVMIASALAQYFLWRWRFRRLAAKGARDVTIIDGEYRVIDPDGGAKNPRRGV